MGLTIGVVILAASAHDNEAGIALLDQASERCGMRLEKAVVDQGFKDAVIVHGAVKDITVEVVRRNPDDRGKGFVPQPKRWVVEQVNGTLMLHRASPATTTTRPATRLPAPAGPPPPACSAASPPPPPPGRTTRIWPRERPRTPAAAADRHDETAARADSLREQIEGLTTALVETEDRLAELAATRKVIDDLAPRDHATAPAETATATVYQRIVTAFNEHLGKAFRVRDLHARLGLPTDEPSINVARSRLGRLVREGLLEQPGRDRYQKRT
ncbi:hypothetical protein ACFWG7_19150 [Streptomyces koyangensis]|uniref:hypothetical protein n=1 Tax=Streptomyces koyangensis TaxID=188770 RepID=UPI00216AF288